MLHFYGPQSHILSGGNLWGPCMYKRSKQTTISHIKMTVVGVASFMHASLLQQQYAFMGLSVCHSYSLNQSTKYISLSSTGCWCCCRYFLDTKSPDTHQSVRIQWRHTVIQHLLPPSLYTIKIGNHEDITWLL